MSLPAFDPGSLGDLCSMAWWKGLKADAPTGCGCVCGWWPGGGGRQCGGRDPRGNPPHPWPAPCSRPRCCNPVQSKKCRLHVPEDTRLFSGSVAIAPRWLFILLRNACRELTDIRSRGIYIHTYTHTHTRTHTLAFSLCCPHFRRKLSSGKYFDSLYISRPWHVKS